MNDKPEKRILKEALKRLDATTGVKTDLLEHVMQQDENCVDAIGRVNILKKDVVFEVKRNLTLQALGGVVLQMERIHKPAILVTDYINQKMAERLKERDIWFLDTAGNAYINQLPVFVFVTGRKAQLQFEKAVKNPAFQATGLKVIFALLHDEQLINAPYRLIAERADVALGTVGKILTGLRELGFLVEYDDQCRRLKNRAQLIERWAIAYPEVLRPKLLIGRFTTNAMDKCKQLEIHQLGAFWGGEYAAEKLTNYLKPEKGILYTHGETGVLQLKCQLKKDPDGKLELLRAFWNQETRNYWRPNTAPPLVIYADLLATGDPRNIETAKMIYGQELARLVRED